MRKFLLLFLSGLFPDFGLYAERNKCDTQTGDSKRGPPEKNVNLIYLNVADGNVSLIHESKTGLVAKLTNQIY